jgi:hypothetical protein
MIEGVDYFAFERTVLVIEYRIGYRIGGPDFPWLAPILCTRCCESRINRYRCVLGPA